MADTHPNAYIMEAQQKRAEAVRLNAEADALDLLAAGALIAEEEAEVAEKPEEASGFGTRHEVKMKDKDSQ